uniref:M-phase inducer phosphatase 2-like n=1 Tax=Myxine glutinosa TaxID=7769 RepID=UPI00358E7F8D
MEERDSLVDVSLKDEFEHPMRPLSLSLSSLASPSPTTASPVASLTSNLGHFDFGGTPKRPLTCQSVGSFPNFNRHPSFLSDCSDQGLCLDSPLSFTDDEIEKRFEKAVKEKPVHCLPGSLIRRFNSVPHHFLSASPSLLNESSSSPDTTPEEDKENVFKRPAQPIKSLQIEFGAGAKKRINSLPAALGKERGGLRLGTVSLIAGSTAGIKENVVDSDAEDDDEFLEFGCGLQDSEDSKCPKGLTDLFTKPLCPRTSCDFGINFQELVEEGGKRGNQSSETSPLMHKRRRSVPTEEVENDVFCLQARRRRSWSAAAVVDHALTISSNNPDLIGDFTKPFILPVIPGLDEALKYISPETMSVLLHGEFEDAVDKFIVVDCRYPYEFAGGHIKGAINVPTEELAGTLLFDTPSMSASPERRLILIFHCEFSVNRGPKMCHHVREVDRNINTYPYLHYPELYILAGGYREFFSNSKTSCEPQCYVSMDSEVHKVEMKACRQRSRSWAGERSRRHLNQRLKKL